MRRHLLQIRAPARAKPPVSTVLATPTRPYHHLASLSLRRPPLLRARPPMWLDRDLARHHAAITLRQTLSCAEWCAFRNAPRAVCSRVTRRMFPTEPRLEPHQRRRIMAATESTTLDAPALQPWNVPFAAAGKYALVTRERLVRRSRLAQYAPGPSLCHCGEAYLSWLTVRVA